MPFLFIPLGIHAVYRWLIPGWLSRVRGRVAQLGLHAVVLCVATVAVSLLIHPLFFWVIGAPVNLRRFLVADTILCVALLASALAIQQQRTEREAAEREARLQAQLQASQARTNPHFLFNSLTTIASLIVDDPQRAERAIEQLAELLRYSLDSGRTPLVPLSREVEIVQAYIEAQLARFGDRLRFRVELDPRAAAVRVPPLLLQPVVENALLHGGGQSPRRRAGRDHHHAPRGPGDPVRAGRRPGPGTSLHRGSGTSQDELRARLALLYGAAAELYAGAEPADGISQKRLEAAIAHAGRRSEPQVAAASPPDEQARATAALSALSASHGPVLAPRVIVIEQGTIRFFAACEVTRFFALDKYTAFLNLRP